MIMLENQMTDYPPKAYIQNRVNWCWVVACKILGQRYKLIYPQWDFSAVDGQPNHHGVVTHDLNGLRLDAAGRYHNTFTVDVWQNSIVANLTGFNEGGNVKGDDEEKERGIKYVIAGSSEEKGILVSVRGGYKDTVSVFERYDTQIKLILSSQQYILANTVLDTGKFHTVVILDIRNDAVNIYDPWDGAVISSTIADVFYRGFKTCLGVGIVKWIQYIDT